MQWTIWTILLATAILNLMTAIINFKAKRKEADRGNGQPPKQD